MEQLKAIYKALAVAAAKFLNKVLGGVEPLIRAPKEAKKAGKKPSFVDYLKCALGVVGFLIGWTLFAVTVIMAANLIAAILSIVFSAWVAQLLAAIIMIGFELEVFHQLFEVEVQAGFKF